MINKPVLTIELVPAKSWGDSLQKKLSHHNWDLIRHQVYQNANHRCEICGGVGTHHPVDCHEIWQYDDDSKVQKLIGFIALCPACHGVKHFGRSSAIGRADEALIHLMQVNNWTKDQSLNYIDSCYNLWKERSKHNWQIDVTLLQQYGIKDIMVSAEKAEY